MGGWVLPDMKGRERENERGGSYPARTQPTQHKSCACSPDRLPCWQPPNQRLEHSVSARVEHECGGLKTVEKAEQGG